MEALGPSDLVVRRRGPADVPAVVEVLLRQQPLSRYPFRNPLPFPVEDFVVRRGQIAAWVAALRDEDRGRVVGHVGATAVEDGESARIWTEAVGRPVTALGEVRTLVVDPDVRGAGVGGRLLDAVEQHFRDAELTPVLEVLTHHAAAHRLYLERGWEQVGTARFDWLPATEPPVCLMVLR